METVRMLRGRPWGIAGAVVVLLVVLTAALAPVVAPYPVNEIHFDSRMQAPGNGYVLGTDNLGRDVFSRLLYGPRPYVQAALTATGMALGLGLLLGLLAARVGARGETVMRSVLLVLAILVGAGIMVTLLGWAIPAGFFWPDFMTTLAGLAGPTLTVTVIVPLLISLALLPSVVGVARQTAVLGLRELGRSLVPVAIVGAGVAVGMAMLVLDRLSYLGMGVPPPLPSWGAMLSGMGRQQLNSAPWVWVAPAAAMGLTLLGTVLFGAALHERWFPRSPGYSG